MDNREIKFRLWNPSRKVLTAGIHLNTLLLTTDAEFVKDFHEQEMIWMQYTGLRDKNGKEIYEGDFLRRQYYADGTSDQWLVKFGWMPRGGVGFYQQQGDRYYYDNYQISEISGNIYEHRHLLSPKENKI